jgi:hypothetical protein
MSAGSFYRDPGSAATFGFQRSFGGRGKRRLRRYYSSGARSLLFRGRKRKFFIGYIPFGAGAKPLQRLTPAYDFSLGHLRLSFFFRGARRGHFFLGRGSHKARAPRRPQRLLRPRQRLRLPLARPRQRLRLPVSRALGRGAYRRRAQRGRGAYHRRAQRGRKPSLFKGFLRWLFNKRFF